MTTQPEWNFHEQRNALLEEAHARPAQSISAPAEILHVAFRADRDTFNKFFKTLDATDNASGMRHMVGVIKGIRIKLEQHTEFMSCTLFQDITDTTKSIDLPEFFHENFPTKSIEVLVLLRLDILKTMRELVRQLPTGQRIYGGKIRDGIDVRSTFLPEDDGAIRVLVFAKQLTGEEMGRRLQRLIEMETYRTMCLLGLSRAREVSSILTSYEAELHSLNQALREDHNSSQENYEELFDHLSSLSERNNALATRLRYRFSASRAYFDLFQQRAQSLEEVKVGDIQTMSGFLRSRLNPAMATIDSTAKRQMTLTEDLSRTLVLLRTRIELNLNKGNQALLTSMDRRHDQQLKISQAVEGLSVIAITYYGVGLTSYLLKALAKQSWMPLSATLLTAISVPFVLALVWVAIHRARHAWVERSDKS